MNHTAIKNNKITFKLKTYIQPFERVLANNEILSLMHGKTIIENGTFAQDTVTIQNTADLNIEFLQKRLSYWERVGEDDKTFPTLQTILEMSPDDLNVTNDILTDYSYEELPRRRILRYGTHDIHEYRGKFFPQLVKSLINISGIGEGSVVLDPFGGSGTTSCEASLIGMDSIAVDLNPLSVLISKVKSNLLDLDHELLYSQTLFLFESINMDDSGIPTNRWNEKDLDYLYRWFDKKALEEICIILDKIDCLEQQHISDFFKVCLSNVIRGISWQKESDLRVRKEIKDYKLGMAKTVFIEEVKRQLDKVIPFLKVVNKYIINLGKANIVEGDTKKIRSYYPDYFNKCDVLITSPPYATALPYLDTDRLSLIVLNLLPRTEHKNKDIDMIGNREVSENQRKKLWDMFQQRKDELPEIVVGFIENLANHNHNESTGFRKKNLPALLAKYFLDMSDSMKQSLEMMKEESYGFYVVGNNSTTVNGEKIEIPTEAFLWDIGEKVGWTKETIINMDLLPSRDIFRNNRGTSESILIFKKKSNEIFERKAIYSNENLDELLLKGNEWNFHEENTQQNLHSLHPYPARFIPQIPRKAILQWSKPGDTILDPFCGSGTTLLEASSLGRKSIGIDNNAVACLVSRAKVTKYNNEQLATLTSFCSDVQNLLHKNDNDNIIIPEYKNIEYWFDEQAIKDLGKINWYIEKLQGNAKLLATSVLSSIIVRVSYQDSDTRYSRKEYEYVKDSAIKFYYKKMLSVLSDIKQNKDLVKAHADVYQLDGRDLFVIEDNSIDLIVTSPPYLNAYDYHKYHRHRLHWIKGDVEFARNKEIGKHDTYTRPKATPDSYFEDMKNCFSEWKRVLKPDSKVVIVIGDAIVNKKPVSVGDKFIQILEELGLHLEERSIRTLLSTKKSFNASARMNQEHILVFKN